MPVGLISCSVGSMSLPLSGLDPKSVVVDAHVEGSFSLLVLCSLLFRPLQTAVASSFYSSANLRTLGENCNPFFLLAFSFPGSWPLLHPRHSPDQWSSENSTTCAGGFHVLDIKRVITSVDCR